MKKHPNNRMFFVYYRTLQLSLSCRHPSLEFKSEKIEEEHSYEWSSSLCRRRDLVCDHIRFIVVLFTPFQYSLNLHSLLFAQSASGGAHNAPSLAGTRRSSSNLWTKMEEEHPYECSSAGAEGEI